MSDKAELEKIPRVFTERTAEDQASLLQFTWCDQCQAVDLGMTDPQEYQLGEQIWLEGRCKNCGEIIATEVIDQLSDEDESW